MKEIYDKIKHVTKGMSNLQDLQSKVSSILEKNQDLIKNIDTTSKDKKYIEEVAQMQDYGRTILYYAIYDNNINAIKLFLNCGADIGLKDGFGRNYLHHAVIAGKKDIIQLLLERGLKVDEKDSKGFTLLHYAAAYGHKEIAELLINNGANINEKDKQKVTPLHLAVSNCCIDVVLFLVEKGASIEAQDEYGLPPLYYAKLKQNTSEQHESQKHKSEIYARIATSLKDTAVTPLSPSPSLSSKS